jgi:pyruvate/2-oxoglutarate dehydrogenase complex dihydrolipoamide acyltransferase (E2) component
MPTEILLPQWGMGMREGTVLRWLKAVGDPVVEDEPIVDIEAEKTENSVFAPADGVLGEIRAEEGETIRVGSVLGLIN